MKTVSLVLLATLLTVGGSAQQKTAALSPGSGAVSEATVDQFLQRMYGFDPTIKWKIVAVRPTAASGITEVVYYIGAEPRPVHLYVTSDGQHAIGGQMIPFGTDPFGADRVKVAQSKTGILLKGDPNAKVALVVFSDLECPVCKAAEPTIEKLQAETPGTKLVMQLFPLTQIHPWAMKAALYSDCVAHAAPDKVLAFNDSVFDQQEQINPQNASDKLNALVQAQGLDAAKISACTNSSEAQQRVQQSVDLAKSLDVNGTPTLFIHGRKTTGVNDYPYETLKQMVDYEVQREK